MSNPIEKPVRDAIARNIRKHRKASGMSAEELGSMLNPKRAAPSVRAWEQGRAQPDADTAVMLCVIFGISIVELCGLESVDSELEEHLLKEFRSMNYTGKTSLIACAHGLKAVYPEDRFLRNGR